jgi:ATP-binding cassette, subfamily B, bacterial
MYDDDNYDDGIDEIALASGMRLELWRRLFTYARRYPRHLWTLGVFAVITACVEVSYPLITRAVIDEVAAHGADAQLWLYGLAYAVATIVLALSIGAFIWAGGKLRTHISHDIRRDGFENLQQLSFSFYDYRPVGWLMARMTSDCDRLSNILVWGLLDLVWGVTMMTGIAAAMLIMNPKLALVAFVVLPILGWVSVKFQRRILRSAREVRRTNSRITATYNESIMGVLTSKAFVRESANQRDFSGLTHTMQRASVQNAVQAATYVPIVVTLSSLAVGLTLAVGGLDVIGGVITTGTLIAFMTYARHFFEPVEQMGRWFAEMQMAQAAAERVISLIQAEPDIRDDPARLLPPERQAATQRISRIELKQVNFAYDPSTPVLKDVDLVVSRGDVVAIVGPTGGGKTTLVNLICRFYEPTSGDVLIDGVDYRRRGLHWLQSKLGMVLQQAHIFSGTIRDNIRYGRLEATDDEVLAAAKLAGANEFIEALDDGYDTQVGEGGGRLSAGQKQLISFARAILADPEILVMDEATSSVDTETEQRIQQGLHHVLAGRICFVIAHRLSTIRNATRIVVVQDGRITESGSHDELMALRGHYFELYRQQSLRETAQRLGAVPSAIETD